MAAFSASSSFSAVLLRNATSAAVHVPRSISKSSLVDKTSDPIPFSYSFQTCIMFSRDARRICLLPLLWFWLWFGGSAFASLGDRLPEFRECVRDCIATNCGENGPSIPISHRLLLWTCPAECDYACQHIITDQRLARDPPYLEPVLQFHGKWPFYRLLGIQEPASVLFSLLNFLAHQWGIGQVKQHIPAKYGLRQYYLLFGYFGLASWIFSMIFHTRDFNVTEKLDYFAAGASVMYGLYYAPIRIFRLDQRLSHRTPTANRSNATIVRVWTLLCVSLYLAHVSYLSFVRFDYTYNMAANVVIGILQNILWTSFAIYRYRKYGKTWMAWPGFIVLWIVAAMSLELFDFPPWHGMLDAHSMWHLGTVWPVIWMYRFLIKDAQEDLQKERLRA